MKSPYPCPNCGKALMLSNMAFLPLRLRHSTIVCPFCSARLTLSATAEWAGTVVLAVAIVAFILAFNLLYYPLCVGNCKLFMQSSTGEISFLIGSLLIVYLLFFVIGTTCRNCGGLVRSNR
jgi:hypothetical protein